VWCDQGAETTVHTQTNQKAKRTSKSNMKHLQPTHGAFNTRRFYQADATATAADIRLTMTAPPISILTSSSTSKISSSSSSKDEKTKTRRTVQFVEGGHETLLIEQLCELPVEELWFTGDDYSYIKAQSRIDSKEWRKKGFGLLLQDTFQDPRPDAQDYINAFCQLSGDDNDLCRRGLERHLSRKHGEERSDNKDRARYTVLSQQRKLRKHINTQNQDAVAEQLAMLYQDVTRTAKIFARRVAKGDEVAVKMGCDDVPAQGILDQHESTINGQSSSSGRPHGRTMERRLSNFSVKSANSYNSNFSNPVMKSSSRSSLHLLPSTKTSSSRSWLSTSGRSSATGPSYNAAARSTGTSIRVTPRSKCPSSPATPMEEYYAAIA
jgi:hypothetical protein